MTTDNPLHQISEEEYFIRKRFPNIVDFVDNRLKHYDGSHDVEHARRVLKNCCFISSSTRGVEIAYLASYAHDACDHKYGNAFDLQECLFNACVKDNMSYNDAMQVMTIVAYISYSRLRNLGIPKLESSVFAKWRIVSDADILEAMGMTGIVRTIMYQAFKKKPLVETFQYIQGPLFDCSQYLHHRKSQKEGMIRHKFMIFFMSELHSDNSFYNEVTKQIYERGRQKSSFCKTWNSMLEFSNGKCQWLHSQMVHESNFGTIHMM
jgi:HD superfamily phosphodiesterase